MNKLPHMPSIHTLRAIQQTYITNLIYESVVYYV
jgi:hypothetical protein